MAIVDGWSEYERQCGAYDPVEYPEHYVKHASGIEPIEITQHMNFCRGNAVKYIWRAGSKGDEVEDLRKAIWYLEKEIVRLSTPPAATRPQAKDHITCLSKPDDQVRVEWIENPNGTHDLRIYELGSDVRNYYTVIPWHEGLSLNGVGRIIIQHDVANERTTYELDPTQTQGLSPESIIVCARKPVVAALAYPWTGGGC